MNSRPDLSSRYILRATRQRGVALITAVLIVALATILAIQVGFNGYLDQRRAATAFALDQGFQVAIGAEAWAADILEQDVKQGKRNQQDDFTEAWATPIPPIPLENGEVQGQLEDMQGRFNLNSLVMPGDGGKLEKDPRAVKRLQHLLQLVDLEEKWATVITDWIDSDLEADGSDGAEDSAYSSLTPAYRTPNMPITRASELLALTGFGQERYRKLEPFVTALPLGTPINLCTAPPEVLDSLLDGKREFSTTKQTTADLRKEGCHPSVNLLIKSLQTGGPPNLTEEAALKAVIGTTSSYFRASIWVTIGTTQFTLYSLLSRDKGGKVRPILRSFGTP